MWLAYACLVLSILLLAIGGGFFFVRILRRQIRAELRRAPARPRAMVRRIQLGALAFLVAGFVFVAWVSRSLRAAGWVVPLVPIYVAAHVQWRAAAERRRLEADALAHWYALRGFVASGISLPHALFRLAEPNQNRYAKRLRRVLERYEDGSPLGTCLERFRQKLPLRLSGSCLVAIEVAYAQGLPLVPLLDEVLPVLEWERAATVRLGDLRRAALAQAIFAFLLPWGVLGASRAIAPELFNHGIGGAVLFAVVAGCLVWEILGAVVLWKLSAFY